MLYFEDTIQTNNYFNLQTLLTYELIRDYHEQFADCSNMIMQLFLLSDVILYTQKDYPPLQKFYDLRASLIKYFSKYLGYFV